MLVGLLLGAQFTTTIDVAYTENVASPEQKLDLYLPSHRSKKLLIYVHGGAWVSGDKREYAAIAKSFVAEKLAVAVVNYRLARPPNRFAPTDPTEDVTAAIKFLGARANRYGFDAKKMFLVGHSAGAHIAGMIASRQSSLTGIVGIEGIYDIPSLSKVWPTYDNWFLNRAFGTDQAGRVAESPTRLKGFSKVPWLVIHSKKDELVDLGQSMDFIKHLKAEKVAVSIYEPESTSHFGTVAAIAAPKSEIREKILAFIQAH